MSIDPTLKIGYFADGPWAHNAFHKLISDKTIDIKFIVPRNDSVDETLRDFAKGYNIDYLKGYKINTDEFYAIAQKYGCDLFVSMSYNQIFKNKITNLPRLGTINCHAGKLPFYRGRNILNWALINDEEEFGITVHYIDEGIDTGDIILQQTFPITDNDDYQTLLSKAYVECPNVLYSALKLVQSNKHNPIKQNTIHPLGFYCGRRTIGDEIIDWNNNSRDIFNFIRAICKPGPIARSFIDGKEIQINKARLINAPSYKMNSGMIVSVNRDSFYVKTKDSFIEIIEYYFDGKVKIGDRLTGR